MIDNNCKVLITGATGTLGNVLGKHLDSVYSCVPIGYKNAPKNGYQVDLTNKTETESFLDEISPDIIVHAAAITDVDECEKEISSTYSVNVSSVINLLDWCKKDMKCYFCFISTDQIYTEQGLSLESELIQPVNVYALTKLWGENIVSNYANYIILRTNFFGKNNSLRSPLNWLLYKIENNSDIRLFNDVLYNPLFLEDLCEVILELLMGNVTGIYNLGSHGNGISKADFFLEIAEKNNIQLPDYFLQSIDECNLLAKRPKDMRMDVSKVENILQKKLPDIHESIDNFCKKCN